MSLLSSDPQYAQAAKMIANMPPAQALQYLTDHNLPAALAVGILEQAQLKKRAQQQQQSQQAVAAIQGQPQTALDSTKSQFKQAMDQYKADASSNNGIAGLPVPNSMFSATPGMKAGGIVAFAAGDQVQAQEQADTQTPVAEAYYANLINQQNAMRQQAAAQAQKQDSTPVMAAAKGGKVKRFATGGHSIADLDPAAQEDLKDRYASLIQPVTENPAGYGNVVGYKIPNEDTIYSTKEDALARFGFKNNPPPAAAPPPASAPTGVPSGTPEIVTTATSTAKPSAAPAFGSGAMANLFKTPKEIQDIMDQQQKIRDAANPLSVQQDYDQLTDIANKEGIGKAIEAHLQNLDARRNNLQDMAKQGKWMSLAQAGFAIADAATRNPHGGFLGALAVGGAKGGQDFLENLKDYRTQSNQLQDATYAVQQAKENMLQNRTAEAIKMHENAETRYDRLSTLTTDTALRVAGLTQTAKDNALYRAAIAASREQKPPDEVYHDLIRQGVSPIDALTQINKASASAQNATLSATEKRQQAMSKILADPTSPLARHYQDLHLQLINETDPSKQQALAAQLYRMESIASGDYGFDPSKFTVRPKT
jgi:hypothetical protein